MRLKHRLSRHSSPQKSSPARQHQTPSGKTPGVAWRLDTLPTGAAALFLGTRIISGRPDGSLNAIDKGYQDPLAAASIVDMEGVPIEWFDADGQPTDEPYD